jgi:hypothetical protein
MSGNVFDRTGHATTKLFCDAAPIPAALRQAPASCGPRGEGLLRILAHMRLGARSEDWSKLGIFPRITQGQVLHESTGGEIFRHLGNRLRCAVNQQLIAVFTYVTFFCVGAKLSSL